jgi:hypothetical protein
MKARLHFDVEGGKSASIEVTTHVRFSDYVRDVSRSAPNGLLYFDSGAFPYSRLCRIEKLED